MSRWVYLLLFVWAALLPFGCATAGGVVGNLQRTQADIEQALNDLADFSLTDLRSALTAAEQQQDIEAVQCYGGLAPIIQDLQRTRAASGGKITLPVGAFSTFQGVRNLVRGSLGVGAAGTTGPSLLARINVACTPLIASMDVDILKIAAKVGSAMSGVGAAPAALSALKGIVPLLKLLPLPIPLP